MNKPELLHVSPAECTPAPWFNRTDLALTPEFLADIKKNGVRQSLLVRKLPLLKSARHLYEIVAGCRRHAAALKGNVAEIPVMVADLTDQEAREARITENLQRENLNALDEARQFQNAMGSGDYGAGSKGVEKFAVSIGKSRALVYSRLRLLQLGPAVVEAMKAGRLSAAVAELIATLPGQKIQEQALKKVLENGSSTWDPDDEWADDNAAAPKKGKRTREAIEAEDEAIDAGRRDPMSFRAVKAMLNQDFRLDLKEDARWKLDDAKLLPSAGACLTCPKRSGTEPDAFPEIKNPNLCTDPDCFAAKRAVCDTAALKEHIDAGHKVMTPQEHAKAFSTTYGVGGPWAGGSEYSYKIGGTFRDKLGKSMPEPTYAVDKKGKVGAYYKKSELMAAAQAKGLLKSDDGKPAKNETPEAKAKREAAEAAAALEAKIKFETAQAAVAVVLKPVQAGKQQLGALQFLLHDTAGRCNKLVISKRRGWENFGLAQKLGAEELLALLAEACLIDRWGNYYTKEDIENLAKHVGVKIDWKALEKEARARLTPPKLPATFGEMLPAKSAKAAKPAKVATKAKK